MTIGGHDELTEVVSLNTADIGPAAVSTSDPAGTMAYQTETFTSDPYAVRREQTIKVQKGIYLLFGILEGLLGIRFVLAIAGRQPGCGLCAVHQQHYRTVHGPVRGAVSASRASGAASST